ncbi:MAG: alpha/beta fold hydrolase [Candidatus Latescibacteria bacterium]|nr:alpha/beta fold hydrolase [Candidatus Latescibacterota bacterium]
METQLTFIVYIVVGCFLCLWGIRYALILKNTAEMKTQLAQFTPIEDLDLYYESRPRIYGGSSKQPHALLMLHGYSGSTHEFDTLTKTLEQAQIPYYAPMLTGFGLNNFRLLNEVAPADWLRDAIVAYDALAAVAHSISILGHSTGGTIAMYVASHRPVKHLVLSGPNIFPSPTDKKYKAISQTPILSDLIRWCLPIFSKPVRPGRVVSADTLDSEVALSAMTYRALPTHSLCVQWLLQDMVDVSKAEFEDLTLIYGEHDVTVDMDSLIEQLEKRQISYQSFSFANSAHNVLQDYDRDDVAEKIRDVLVQ